MRGEHGLVKILPKMKTPPSCGRSQDGGAIDNKRSDELQLFVGYRLTETTRSMFCATG